MGLVVLLAAFAVGAIAWAAVAAETGAPPAGQRKAAAARGVKTTLPHKAIPQGIGFNVHLTGPEEEWDKIKESGLKFVRTDFTWEAVERNQGQYDFARYDPMVDALSARGIRVLFILCYNNKLYAPATVTEEGREAYARWAAASAKHFTGRNVLWEIWNEPNVGFWRGGKGGLNSTDFADQYVALVKKAVPAMRAADPDCYILGGAVSCLWRDSFRWTEQAFKQGLLKTGINALSVHPYGFARPELCIDANQPGAVKGEGYGNLREMMARYGAPKDFPVVNTEVGYAVGDRGVGGSREHQAMLFVRTCLVDQMCDMRTTIWYNWDGNGGHEVRGGGPAGRPVYRACKNMVAELTGYHFVERLKAGSNVDYVLAFENASGGRKIVAWTVPQERDVPPDRAKVHDLAIPTGGARVVAVRDLYGNGAPAKVAPGSVTVTLTGSPLYIGENGDKPHFTENTR